MRKAATVVILALCCAPVLLMAQSPVDKELTRAALEANRKLIVNENMSLVEEEKEKFWSLYDEYQKELSAINERKAALITDYADNYYSLTDEKAGTLLKDALDIEDDHVKLKKKYMKKFQKDLSTITVARYFQLENKFEAIVQYELARRIPLVR